MNSEKRFGLAYEAYGNLKLTDPTKYGPMRTLAEMQATVRSVKSLRWAIMEFTGNGWSAYVEPTWEEQ